MPSMTHPATARVMRIFAVFTWLSDHSGLFCLPVQVACDKVIWSACLVGSLTGLVGCAACLSARGLTTGEGSCFETDMGSSRMGPPLCQLLLWKLGQPSAWDMSPISL